MGNWVWPWQAQDTRVSNRGNLLKETAFYNLSPYANVSLGVGSNKASKYSSTPLIFEALPEPVFRLNTTTAFTYAAGVGVQRALNAHLQAGIAYECVDWGKNALAAAPGQSMGGGLSLNHYYTNGLMFTWLTG